MEIDTTRDFGNIPENEYLIRILQMLLDRKLAGVMPALRSQWPSVKVVLDDDIDDQFPYDRYYLHLIHLTTSSRSMTNCA